MPIRTVSVLVVAIAAAAASLLWPGQGHAARISPGANTTVQNVLPAPLPTARWSFPLVRGSDNLLYAIGGTDGTGTIVSRVDAYDPASGAWISRHALPVNLTSHVAVAATNGKIYAFGGYTGAPPTLSSALYEYSPGSDSWTTRTPWPSPRPRAAAALGDDGRVYLAGGLPSIPTLLGPSQSVDVYDPSSDTWSSAAELFPTRADFGLTSGQNGTLYAIAGRTSALLDQTQNVMRYGIGSDSWTSDTSLPSLRSSFGVATIGSRIFVVSGDFDPTFLGGTPAPEVFVFETATHAWSKVQSIPTPRESFGMAAGADGRVYAVGGVGAHNAVLDRLEIYDPATDTWQVSDVTAPIVSSLSFNGGALTTTSTAVTLGIQASDPAAGYGVSQMSFSNDGGGTWSAWESFAATKSWTLTSGDGVKTVQARVRDGAGNVSAAISAQVALDTALGTDWGMTIDDAAVWSSSLDVTLHIAARAGTARMQVSNDGAFFGAQWEPFTAHKPWHMLAPPRPDLITETVFVRFGDADGNVISGSLVQDTIFLDTVPPTGSVAISSGTSVQSPTRQLSLTASDDLSGLNGMRISNRADFAGARWQTFAGSVPWDFNGGGTVYAQFKDGAGNLSQTYSQTLPGSAPPGTSPTVSCSPRPPVQVNLQKANGALVATLATSGASNGLRAVRFDTFSNASVDVGSQTNQTQPFAVSLPAGQEPTSLQFTVRRTPGAQSATVRLVVIDGCGEWSTFVGGGPSAW